MFFSLGLAGQGPAGSSELSQSPHVFRPGSRQSSQIITGSGFPIVWGVPPTILNEEQEAVVVPGLCRQAPLGFLSLITLPPLQDLGKEHKQKSAYHMSKYLKVVHQAGKLYIKCILSSDLDISNFIMTYKARSEFGLLRLLGVLP